MWKSKGGSKMGIMMYKLKWWINKRALLSGNERVDAKGGHYDVQIKRVDG